MARKKAPEAKLAEPEKIEKEVVVETAAPVKKEEAKEVKKPAVTSTMVMVKNLRKTFFYQPGTGLRIEGGETKELRNDSWLEMQVAAKLLEVVA